MADWIFSTVIIVVFMLFVSEVMHLILPGTYKLSKKQSQCSDCKYLRYIDTNPGYLCCEQSIVDLIDIYHEKSLFGKDCVYVGYANTHNNCDKYKKSLIK